MTALMDRLYKALGYRFSNPQLLEAALTHRSLKGINNERLEFLGDSIINFLIAEELYQRCPGAHEGELSRLRSSLVKGDTLAEMAKELDLGHYLRLGSGELKSGGFHRSSILADAMEAIIAAIYLDSGMDVCRVCVLNWYQSRFGQSSQASTLKDPKTRLQEYLQSCHFDLPRYQVQSVSGEAHAQTFIVACVVDSLEKVAEGQGKSRRKAEQDAAEKLLKLLGVT
jgi:ribonuclease III